jgi:hypothetical protein
MDRNFDYSQKVLVAVEFNVKPSTLPVTGLQYTRFQRIAIPAVKEAFAKEINPLIRLLIGKKFANIVDQRMGYWESRIPAGQVAFVHYLIGSAQDIDKAYLELQASFSAFVMVGVYHLEPQSSSSPYGFPAGTVPSYYYLGEEKPFTENSVFWFNFFPAQPYLFEKTFRVWCLFQISKLKEGGDCNQLVTLDSGEKLKTNGIDQFVQINLNRFQSIKGYFAAAAEAGRKSFTRDPDYQWYGMLLKKIPSR